MSAVVRFFKTKLGWAADVNQTIPHIKTTHMYNYQYRIGRHWLPLATNNLPIDYQCTI